MQRGPIPAPKPATWFMGMALALGIGLPGVLQAQENPGSIVVARDVPTRHAFLPGTGEPLLVKTAPFGDVWSGINPSKILTDDEANAVVGRLNVPGGGAAGVLSVDSVATSQLGMGALGADRGSSGGSGVAGIVGQALDSGLGSLKTGLDQVQSALGSR